MGWTIGAAIVFGLSLSVASTVVVLRTLEERRLLETERGRIAVGWLIVEDVAVILALVLLPSSPRLLGGVGQGTTRTTGLFGWFETQTVWGALSLTVVKIGAFVLLMMVVGKRVIPMGSSLLRPHRFTRTLSASSVGRGSGGRLWRCGIIWCFPCSGAFFAGVILAESKA